MCVNRKIMLHNCKDQTVILLKFFKKSPEIMKIFLSKIIMTMWVLQVRKISSRIQICSLFYHQIIIKGFIAIQYTIII